MCSNYPYPGINLEYKIEHLWSYAQVVHTTTKQIISRRGKNENVCEMFKNDKCTCKACRTIVFHRQICKFRTFLLPSSSWFLKGRLHARAKVARIRQKLERFQQFLQRNSELLSVPCRVHRRVNAPLSYLLCTTGGPFLEIPEKPFIKLRAAYSGKLVFSYVVKGIKIKITAKFCASRPFGCEDTKRIVSPEMRPKSFGAFEKRAPATPAFSEDDVLD